MIKKLRVAYYKFRIKRNEKTIHDLRVAISSHSASITEKGLYRKYLNDCEKTVDDLEYKISLIQ